jgi:hypothetical protein
VLAAAATGCSSPPDGETGDASTSDASEGGTSCLLCREASFDGPAFLEIKGVMDQVCGNVDGCHGTGAASFGVQPGTEFSSMIDVTSTEKPPMKRVQPGDPAHSYVYLKLACDGGIVGACMPLNTMGGRPDLAKLFHDWIEAGAPTH